MSHLIAPITKGRIAGFRAAVDGVAREERFLAFLEALPPDVIEAIAGEAWVPLRIRGVYYDSFLMAVLYESA